MSDKRFEIELAEMAYEIMQKAARGELSQAYLDQKGGTTDSPNDFQLAAAAIVEMCRQAFSGEWEGETT
jgi:predicted nucleic acid-binding protein